MGKSAINPAVVAEHSTDIAALKNDLGIVEDGDTATHTIAQGQYVIWQGALYTADAAIASGTTLAASGGNKNLTAAENGGLNALSSKMPKVGYKNITIPAGGSQSETVLFDTPFPAGTSYAVLVTQADQYAYADLYFGSTDRSVNGFKLNGSSNRSASITIQVMWAAIPI